MPQLYQHDHAGLTVVGPFERRTIVGPWGSGPTEREAPGRLRTGRRTPERVAVEVAPWARDAVEIRVRPAGLRPDRWTGRRQLRYFDHAHEAIDELARALTLATPEVPVHHPEPADALRGFVGPVRRTA